jgi:hypothetical protein
MNFDVGVEKRIYVGLFMIALATLMYEILLTRIFSVTMWYHYAFVAISVAMFGMTVGALCVYLLPNIFTPDKAKTHLAISAVLFSASIILSFLTHISTPFVVQGSIAGLYLIAFTYSVITVPFIFSGICVALALTKFPRHVSKLYAADLAGAALGCILLVLILNILDGPTAVIAVAALAGVGALCFLGEGRKLRKMAAAWCALLLLFVIVQAYMSAHQKAWLRLMWVKGQIESKPVYEKWNSFSRIRIYGNPIVPETPSDWGLSETLPRTHKVKQLYMDIDANAATMLTGFHDDLNDLNHLKYDVTNLVHYIRDDANVMVIGSGGGRDILSALVFQQKSIVAVEINHDILKAVNDIFGNFTGYLDRNPKIQFINDEARSYIARSKNRFNIIQVSLIDTWAATAAGAFVLTENSLYTLEAWKIFLNHLEPNGVLTFSRWYYRDGPHEIYRLATLASQSLVNSGINHPQDHMILVRHQLHSGGNVPDGIGTLLVSKNRFSHQDVQKIEEVAGRFKFEVVLSPTISRDPTLTKIASGKGLEQFTANYPINISAPTDNNPFFFQALRIRDLLSKTQNLPERGPIRSNLIAVFVLVALLAVVIVLTFFCVIVPLTLTTNRSDLRGALPDFVFFSGIGLGFMLIEISQMQRLIIFLGHPTYSLSVVLFALLLSSSIGSYLTQKINVFRSAISCLIFLLGALILFGIATPKLITLFESATTPVRILVAIAILFPLGTSMGMAFPLGIKFASRRLPNITPWLWGINGAMSVLASVLGVVIALASGISTSFWVGFLCYTVAVIAFARAARTEFVLIH